ncbi:MAG: Inositol 2-dehydrogenase/D-chiro-inositol 3-dehydrogenase [candidate division BRC1 bacterium ADurb.BinA364]|nr:MAG: Inositol 2-dehydrogenase/D-chiro-inositol 3-dehydrogenase [candidate division BRC1 bacterium ADurb.BinA364]
MAKTYTACVIGGGSGGKLSANALARSPRFELLAIADLKAETRADLLMKFHGIRAFGDYRELLRECPADVVCVSTFASTHEPIARAAMELPIQGLLVEKPLGHTYAAGKAVVEEAKRRRLPLVVPHGMLQNRALQDLLRRVHEGEIGPLRLVEIENSNWDISSAGIHWMHFFVNLIGDDPMDFVLTACDSSTRTWRDGMQAETMSVTLGQTKGGVRVVLHIGDEIRILPDGKKCIFRVIGEDGRIDFYGMAGEYRLFNPRHPNGEWISAEKYAEPGHQRYLEELAGMIDSGQPDYANAEKSLRALEIVDAAYLSNRHRCLVRFPLESFVPPAPSNWDPGSPYSGQGGGRDGRKL